MVTSRHAPRRTVVATLAAAALLTGACTSTGASAPSPVMPPRATSTTATSPAFAGNSNEPGRVEAATTSTSSPAPRASPDASPTTTTSTLPPTEGLRLEVAGTVTGQISPKSIVYSGDGLFFAQNMMYRHTITVYDRELELVATIPDAVELGAFGFDGFTGDHRGAPVEAAFTADGAFAYVSNYQMYGDGFSRPGGDSCGNGNWDDSFLYRIDADALKIDQVIAVGAVPKFVAITPDDALVLVSNWCSFDLSVIDAASGTELDRIELGRHPRGIAVSPDGSTAYVAVMGTRHIAVVDLASSEVDWIRDVGANPRHLVIDPNGEWLYATLNGADRVAKIAIPEGEVVASVRTGKAPRSMVISTDGDSLYVVNYHSDTVSKLRTDDMSEVQELGVADKPIGITYDTDTGDVWVSSYSGVITVLTER